MSSKRPTARPCDADVEDGWDNWTSCSEGKEEPDTEESEEPNQDQEVQRAQVSQAELPSFDMDWVTEYMNREEPVEELSFVLNSAIPGGPSRITYCWMVVRVTT